MPRCADTMCGRWRPSLARLEPLAGALVHRVGALQFNGRWYCSRACVEQAARAGLAEAPTTAALVPGIPRLKLGALLQHAGIIAQPQLDEALAEAGRTGRRIGAELERLGYATAEDVLRALAVQSGVSYLSAFDVTRVERGPAWLPPSMIQALGLVPFEIDETVRRVSVVCAAPVPRAAVRAMVRLTGWTPEVFLVTDRTWQAALEAYRQTSRAAASHQALMVGDVGAAAAHVADVAAHERAVTMRHADCSQYRWVRVEGPQRVSDLLVVRVQKEAECQAEHTAH